MKEKENFFTIEHDKLFNIAWWAKNLAWIVIIIYILSACGQIIQFQNSANLSATLNNQPVQSSTQTLTSNPLDTVRLGVNMSATILKGIVYYLVLKGISLGINMIVETNMNYREEKENEEEL